MVNINSFALEPIAGGLDLQFQGSVVSARVKSDEATALIPVQAVKLVNSYGGIPEVTALAANTDPVFGFVAANPKDISFAAGARLELALQGTVMYMTAGAAIARGAKLEVVNSTKKVITNAGTNPVCGYAYDRAAADGDLIRVFIITPGFTTPQTISDIAGLEDALDASTHNISNTVLLAEINAGKTLVSVPTGKKAIVTGFIARCNGAFTTLTSMNLKVGTAVVASLAQAQMTNGAILFPGETGVTLGAAFGIAGGDGDDIVVDKTGSSAAGGTDVKMVVAYYLIDA